MDVRFLLPTSVKIALTLYNATKYIVKGIKVLAKGKLEVPVLDATAIGVSVFRGDTSTAGSIMFLLGIGELLEEWTHKKSVSDLAKSMSLNIEKVWVKHGEIEEQIEYNKVKPDDIVIARIRRDGSF